MKLKKLGLPEPKSGKKYMYMKRGNLRITIPNPHKEDISGSLVAKIIRQAGISKEEWDNA